jgi:hypothetical protein
VARTETAGLHAALGRYTLYAAILLLEGIDLAERSAHGVRLVQARVGRVH